MEPSFAAEMAPQTRGRAKALPRSLVYVTPCLVMPEGALPPPGTVASSEPAPLAVAPALVVAEPPTAQADDFESFVRALVGAALASGSTRGAAVLRSLLTEARVAEATVTVELLDTLRSRGIVQPDSFEASASFKLTAAAWRDVLRGVGGLESCGDTTLDGWASELLCAVSGAPRTRSADYRRELRRRGVAAFGLLAA